MSYDNDMRGALFVNDKQGNERRPDYRGYIVIQGVEYEISAWDREIKNKPGQIWKSIRAKPKAARPIQSTAMSNGIGQRTEIGQDDIPF